MDIEYVRGVRGVPQARAPDYRGTDGNDLGGRWHLSAPVSRYDRVGGAEFGVLPARRSISPTDWSLVGDSFRSRTVGEIRA